MQASPLSGDPGATSAISDLPPSETVYAADPNMFHAADPSATGRRANRPKKPREKIPPPELETEGPGSNAAYRALLSDPTAVFSPQALGFLPSNYWINLDNTFGDLVTKFFQRKNNANCRFPHKLYNALAIVDANPDMYNYLGVRWVTDKLFKVDKLLFGRVLGISSIDGGLFHHQGNFPSHGFAEVSADELEQLKTQYSLPDVDMDRVRLMYHRAGMFHRGSDEDSVTRCKWQTTEEAK